MCILRIRFKVIVMFAFWYDGQGIFQIGFSGSVLGKPYFMKGLTGNAAREMGVELEVRVS